MEVSSVDNSQPTTVPSGDEDLSHKSENTAPQVENLEDAEPNCEISEKEVTEIMEIIASTGRFWHEWDTLKSLLSFRLKQVLAEYPESQLVAGVDSCQNSLSGETYTELVKRLDEELLSFIDGPPFTIQRLCEILLTAKVIYPKLSKLALALEKNLLVTSTLSISTDPYPSFAVVNAGPGSGSEEIQSQPSPVQNGVNGREGDADEEMADAEAGEETLNNNVEMQDDKVGEKSESSSEPDSDSNPPTEPCPATENVDSTDTQAP